MEGGKCVDVKWCQPVEHMYNVDRSQVRLAKGRGIARNAHLLKEYLVKITPFFTSFAVFVT